MYGQPSGPAFTPVPTPQYTGPRVVIPRLLLACVPVLSLGLLAWVPFLRMALQGRRNRDWAVLCVWVTITLTYAVVAAESPDVPEDGPRAFWFAVLFMLAHLGGATVHAILGDVAVQRYRRRRDTPPAGWAAHHGGGPGPAPAYGYPGPGTPGMPGVPSPSPGPIGAVPFV
ncbi:hypothetical protein, partial [Streptomyces calidiresistens]